MAAKTLADFKSDFSLFLEAGFVAVKQLDETSARRLFQAAQVLSPESTAPLLGMGYIELNKLNVNEAMEIFQAIVSKEPENYLAQTFLGITYLLTKKQREAGEKMIQEVVKKTKDETIINLGKVALEWAEKDLTKLKSPFIK
jgi:predicted Zn-dependent protease